MESLPAVAAKFYNHCKKCGTDRYHLVLAHVDSSTAKVECEVCHAKTKYKVPTARKASTGKTRTPRVKSEATLQNEWQALIDKAGDKPRHRYQLRAQFEKDALIEHPQFGIGLVTASSPQKIEVVFESGVKSLVHNRV